MKKQLKGRHFFVRRGGHCCRVELVERTTFWIVFEWLAKVKSFVAVACFLPGRAKDLSAPRYFNLALIGGRQHGQMYVKSDNEACSYNVYTSSTLTPFHSNRTCLWWFNITGKSKKYLGLNGKCPIFSSDFNQIWKLSTNVHRNPRYQTPSQTAQVWDATILADRPTVTMKVTGAFRDNAKALNICMCEEYPAFLEMKLL